MERGYFIFSCYGQKTLSFFQFHLQFTERAPENKDCNRKMKNWKKGARRWLLFSFLMAPMKNMEEVFFFIPCGTKKYLYFLKYIFVGLEYPSEDDMLNRKKRAI
jgi:hypothetical protein